jgi:flavodoxin
MNALVVYDPQYRNTRRVAEAITRAIGDALGSAYSMVVQWGKGGW